MKIEAEMVEKAYIAARDELTSKEKDIITRYYGIDNKVRHSLAEVAEIYGVTRERIRQIKTVALNKLKVVGKIKARGSIK